jgi:hypothetical protein
MSSLCAQLRESSRVPSLGALLAACSSSLQAALEAVSCLLAEKPVNGPFTSFPYETTGGRNLPLKRTRIKIWANNPPIQNKYLSYRKTIKPVYLCCVGLRPTNVSCTPERQNAVRVQDHTCPINAKTFNHHEHTTYPSKKNVGLPETLGNDSSGAASEPHRFKYTVVGRSLGCEMTG